MWDRAEFVSPMQVVEVAMYSLCGALGFLCVASRRWLRIPTKSLSESATFFLPMLMALLHVVAAGFVNMVPFRLDYLSLPLIAVALAVVISSDRGRERAASVLSAGTLVAALLSMDPIHIGCWSLGGFAFVYWSSLSVALCVGAIIQLAAAIGLRRRALVATGVVTLTVFLRSVDVPRLHGTAPRSLDDWGNLLVAAAFVLLVAGIVVTVFLRSARDRYDSEASPPM